MSGQYAPKACCKTIPEILDCVHRSMCMGFMKMGSPAPNAQLDGIEALTCLLSVGKARWHLPHR